jgi:hypothetical protein
MFQSKLIVDKEVTNEMTEDNYFKNATPNTIPTRRDEESTTPTDLISETVEEIVDNVQDTFDRNSEKKKE